jgi:hypothetical protein
MRRRELANEMVTKLMADATESFKAGQFDKALRTVNEGIAVKDATNTEEAEKLLGKMGNAQPELLFRDAQQAIEQRRYAIAAQRLRTYQAHSRSEKKPEAMRMLKLLGIVLDTEEAKASVKSMTDGQINSLSEGGKLPDNLATTSGALNEAAKATFAKYLPQERHRRQTELAEQNRQEEARLAKETARMRAEADAEERRKREVERERKRVAEKEAEKAKDKLTLSHYYDLKTGMTLNNVISILGADCEEDASAAVPGFSLRMISWKAHGFLDLRMITITFENGRLSAKAQIGLR